MKIVFNPQLIQFMDFVTSIPDQFEKGGLVIQKKRNEIRVFDLHGVSLNVKRFKIPHVFNRIIYTFFRLSKAQRSFQYALKFTEKGIETPQPVAYILTKRGGLLYDSYFISLQVDYNRTMCEFGQGGVKGREHILIAFAIFTAKLHEKGIFHKDYSPANILFKEENGAVHFCLVDLNRMRFGAISVNNGCANFARLWGQLSFFEIVVGKYAEIRSANLVKCMKTALQARRKYWNRYARKHPMPFLPDFGRK